MESIPMPTQNTANCLAFHSAPQNIPAYPSISALLTSVKCNRRK